MGPTAIIGAVSPTTSVPQSPSADASLLAEATELCRKMGEATMRWFGATDLAVQGKADGTPVTQADRAAERLLREAVAERFPNDAVLGEEEPPTPGTSGRTWVVDPIDGTKAFVRGVPLYSSLLAVFDEHGPAVGVICLPALGQVVCAGRGLGCFLDGEPTSVSSVASLGEGCVCSSGFDTWGPGQIEAVLGTGTQLRTWGDGYGFAMVATGRAEAMFDPSVSLWDVAPMPVIISEAGGRFTDKDGGALERMPLDVGAELSGLASNGAVHAELLGVVGAAGR